jgi:hypothetical protein
MAVQTINIGNIANDGTGDDLRAAFVKVNSNFNELDQRIVVQADGANLGTGEGIFYVKDENNMQFKSLVAGDNVTLTSTANEITINAPDPIKSLQFDADVGSFTLTASGGLNFIGAQNIDTTITDNTVTFNIDGENLVVQDTNPSLGGSLDASNFDINNVDVLSVNTINASNSITAQNYVGDVHGIDIRTLEQDVTSTVGGANFGGIITNATNVFDLLLATATIDYGTITSPAGLESDYGTFANPT